jgi:hypothetical protein
VAIAWRISRYQVDLIEWNNKCNKCCLDHVKGDLASRSGFHSYVLNIDPSH